MEKTLKLKKSKIQPRKNKFSPLFAIMLVVLVAYVLVLVGLLFWAVITSLKDENAYLTSSYDFPKTFMFHELAVLRFTYPASDPLTGNSWPVGIPEMLMWSVLYSVGCAAVKTFITCVVAYCCAKFKYKFSKVAYAVVLITMIIPVVGSLPAEIATAKFFGFYDEIWGLWLMQANFLGMYFLVFYEAFASQPKAYAEAAEIDGANNYQVLFKVGLPLVKSIFWTIFIINFIGYWNDAQTPLIYLPTKYTVAYGILRIVTDNTAYYNQTPVRLTASVMLMIPILVFFCCFHKRLLGDLTVGGLKG